MSKTPTLKELKKAFWLEENGVNKYKHNTKHQRYEYKRDKKEVLKEYTKKLYSVWKSEYEYHSIKALDYLLGRRP